MALMLGTSTWQRFEEIVAARRIHAADRLLQAAEDDGLCYPSRRRKRSPPLASLPPTPAHLHSREPHNRNIYNRHIQQEEGSLVQELGGLDMARTILSTGSAACLLAAEGDIISLALVRGLGDMCLLINFD